MLPFNFSSGPGSESFSSGPRAWTRGGDPCYTTDFGTVIRTLGFLQNSSEIPMIRYPHNTTWREVPFLHRPPTRARPYPHRPTSKRASHALVITRARRMARRRAAARAGPLPALGRIPRAFSCRRVPGMVTDQSYVGLRPTVRGPLALADSDVLKFRVRGRS